jgi:hypothetical protein
MAAEKRIGSIEVSENEKWSLQITTDGDVQWFELDLFSIDPRLLDQLKVADGQFVVYKRPENV